MKPYTYALIAAAAACGLASAAETAYTTPVGYVSQTCLNSSDTLVGIPLRQPTVAAAALSANPTIGGTDAVLTVSGAAFGSLAGTHFVKFTSGPDAGNVFAITANDATTITIDRNGQTLTAVSGNTFSVSKFWTLNELFNPATSTNNPATTGTAIVVSANATAGQRRTEVLLPNTTAVGTNLSAGGIYYMIAGTPNQWRKVGTAGDFGNLQLWPDNSLIIRNPSSVTAPTTYTVTGEVETGNVVIPLATRIGAATEKQDNAVALTRPVDVTLANLNLAQTAAFVSSANATAGARRDELLVFNNGVSGLNKSASAIYYFLGGTTNEWRKVGSALNAGSDVIPAGAALLIRKYGTAGGETVLWNNTAPY